MTRASSSRMVGFLFSGGLLLIFIGSFFLYAYPEFVSDNVEIHGRPSMISGVLGVKKGGGQSTGIALYGAAGTMLFSCFQGDCGYPDWRNDIGRNAVFEVFDGRVIRVVVEEQQRFSTQDFANNIERHRNRAAVIALLGLVILIVAFAIHVKARRSASEISK